MKDFCAHRQAGGSTIDESGRAGLGRRPAVPADVSAAQLACDAATVGHMERTGEIAAVLAARANFPARRVERLRRAARLHDIGKSMIGKEILDKPGALDPDELAEMRRHTVIGHQVLASSDDDLSWLAALIALTHHEHFDGDGYPRGLVADQIPIESRIVAIADAFDALRSDRPYRRAVGLDDALALIEQGSGTQFDPTIAALALTHAEALDRARAVGDQFSTGNAGYQQALGTK
jgi:HD-GYP domain-containing protein (c-di-GMP phosphodiesterase class II)